MFKLMVKRAGGKTECVGQNESELVLEGLFQTFLAFAEQSEWTVTKLMNGKHQLRRAGETYQQWMENEKGEVVK